MPNKAMQLIKRRLLSTDYINSSLVGCLTDEYTIEVVLILHVYDFFHIRRDNLENI